MSDRVQNTHPANTGFPRFDCDPPLSAWKKRGRPAGDLSAFRAGKLLPTSLNIVVDVKLDETRQNTRPHKKMHYHNRSGKKNRTRDLVNNL